MRGVRYYDALFHIEDQIKDLSPEERKQKRNDLATIVPFRILSKSKFYYLLNTINGQARKHK